MYHRNRYAQDPRWIVTRYAGRCATCGRTIPAGARAYYYPNGRTLLCEEHGEPAAAEFAAAAWDEENNRCM
jgi:recombinational DNA repair protein (RecF pathway)